MKSTFGDILVLKKCQQTYILANTGKSGQKLLILFTFLFICIYLYTLKIWENRI
jgi:hypothetical protein